MSKEKCVFLCLIGMKRFCCEQGFQLWYLLSIFLLLNISFSFIYLGISLHYKKTPIFNFLVLKYPFTHLQNNYVTGIICLQNLTKLIQQTSVLFLKISPVILPIQAKLLIALILLPHTWQRSKLSIFLHPFQKPTQFPLILHSQSGIRSNCQYCGWREAPPKQLLQLFKTAVPEIKQRLILGSVFYLLVIQLHLNSLMYTNFNSVSQCRQLHFLSYSLMMFPGF